MNSIEKIFNESISTKSQCIDQGFDAVINMGNQIVELLNDERKIMLCG